MGKCLEEAGVVLSLLSLIYTVFFGYDVCRFMVFVGICYLLHYDVRRLGCLLHYDVCCIMTVFADYDVFVLFVFVLLVFVAESRKELSYNSRKEMYCNSRKEMYCNSRKEL